MSVTSAPCPQGLFASLPRGLFRERRSSQYVGRHLKKAVLGSVRMPALNAGEGKTVALRVSLIDSIDGSLFLYDSLIEWERLHGVGTSAARSSDQLSVVRERRGRNSGL